MSSAFAFNLDRSKILLSGNGLDECLLGADDLRSIQSDHDQPVRGNDSIRKRHFWVRVKTEPIFLYMCFKYSRQGGP